MNGMLPKLLAATALLAVTACGEAGRTELGSGVDKGTFGNATMNNTLVQTGQINYTVALAERFKAEVPDTINFEFNRSDLSAEAQTILRKQAAFIKQFPEVRFKVFGYTDLVGSAGYNQALGLRRANATVAYLVSQGISKSRLEAVVSFGKTQPLIQTTAPELLNRRAVTEVSGFVESNPLVLNGKYAEIIFREYVGSATRATEAATGAQSDVGGG